MHPRTHENKQIKGKDVEACEPHKAILGGECGVGGICEGTKGRFSPVSPPMSTENQKLTEDRPTRMGSDEEEGETCSLHEDAYTHAHHRQTHTHTHTLY